MRTKTQTMAICLCGLIGLTQIVSCKKNSTAIAVNSAANTNAVEDSTTDTSLNRGLVAWYTFNGDVLDHSGFHNNVIFNSATPAAGKSGAPKTAYRFDGVSSYMQVADKSSLNPLKISLYALVKVGGFYMGECHSNYIICKETSDYDQGRYLMGFGDQEYYNYQGCDDAVATKYENFFAAYGDGGSTASGLDDPTQYIKEGQWYSVVYTFDGVTSKLYVNGVLVSSAVQQGTIFTATTTPLFIGKTPNEAYPYYFKGIIDELRIYKRAISAQEVTELYNNSK